MNPGDTRVLGVYLMTVATETTNSTYAHGRAGETRPARTRFFDHLRLRGLAANVREQLH